MRRARVIKTETEGYGQETIVEIKIQILNDRAMFFADPMAPFADVPAEVQTALAEWMSGEVPPL
jgi:hypothetical protein